MQLRHLNMKLLKDSSKIFATKPPTLPYPSHEIKFLTPRRIEMVKAVIMMTDLWILIMLCKAMINNWFSDINDLSKSEGFDRTTRMQWEPLNIWRRGGGKTLDMGLFNWELGHNGTVAKRPIKKDLIRQKGLRFVPTFCWNCYLPHPEALPFNIVRPSQPIHIQLHSTTTPTP